VGLNYVAITNIPHITIVRHFLFQAIQNHISRAQRCLDFGKQKERCKERGFGPMGYIGLQESFHASKHLQRF
jgi:hypothetical protein